MNLKKLALGAVALVSAFTLVACGGGSSSENSLEAIKEKGTITVALNPEFAPFEFRTLVDGKDTIVGSDVELANAIGEALGVDVKLSSMSFNNVLASLQSGNADIAISGISATEERKQSYDFSETYYESVNKIIVKKSEVDKYKSLKDFDGKSVATQKGTIQETIAKEQIEGANIVSLVQNGEMINELKSGQVDAVVFEDAIALGYVANNDDLVILDAIELESGDSDAYAVAMPKGSDELKAEIDKVIKDLKDSGKLEEYIEEAQALALNSGEDEE